MTSTNKNISKKLVTHDGSFHSDDVFATAVISKYLENQGEPFEIIRTRDEKIMAEGDYVFDVGGISDQAANRFDHHMPGGAGKHDNGIEYASFGLVWKKFGVEVAGNPDIAKVVEERLVSPIDAGDNAISLVDFKSKIKPYFIQSAFSSFYPSWKNLTMEALYQGFLECVAIAKKILDNEINLARDVVEVRNIIQKIYETSPDKRILVLDQKYPYEEITPNFPELMFVIYPRADGQWGVKAERKELTSFESKKNFPESWAGLRDEELQKVSGVSEATFCHRALFMAVANSQEGAIKLAQIALAS